MSGTSHDEKVAAERGKKLVAGMSAVIIAALAWVFATGRSTGTSTELDFEDGVFGAADAQRLMSRLDSASRAQGVCYGWKIETGRGSNTIYSLPKVPEFSGSQSASDGGLETAVPVLPYTSGVDVGSNLGRSTDPEQAPKLCPRWVIFTAHYSWSEYEETQSFGSFDVESNLDQAPTAADLRAAGIDDAALRGRDAVQRMADAIGLLPMIMTEKGGAAPVPSEAAPAPVASDALEGRRPQGMLTGVLVVLGGLLWILIAYKRSRPGNKHHPEA